ncbi:MAG TPA: betaine/proline/choline family ABC transporter ATP-binding protein [Spirochaetia bacterium]|nr:betaine/proline/choline family ABC transporter ATP-binding protein [Spirochaetia bacterium]
MIELRGVTKKYGDFTAVNNISFTVENGEVCVLIGPSGCGKSTTIKLINRMLEPTTGEILVDGKNVLSERPEMLRRKIGYVIQNIGLFPHMTVSENIAVVPKLLGWEQHRIDERTESLLDLIGLKPVQYASKFPRELSGGEAQRIGVARALAADPPLLLMDEPFGAVDPLNRQVLQAEFQKIQRKLRKTVIFVTHDLDEAIRLADRIVLLDKGRILQNDTPENLLSRPASKFVRNFVGTDRALKRLSRFSVGDHLREAISVALDEARFKERLLELKAQGKHFVWITTGNGRLYGWFDLHDSDAIESDAPAAVTEFEVAETAIKPSFSMKEALSRMLGQGIKAAPVVDDQNVLIGEISLSDIEHLTEA